MSSISGSTLPITNLFSYLSLIDSILYCASLASMISFNFNMFSLGFNSFYLITGKFIFGLFIANKFPQSISFYFVEYFASINF